MSQFTDARLRERNYHIAFYARHTIGDAGTWLEKPAPYALDALQYVHRKAHRALDLGAGIGRHAIPIAQRLGPGSNVVCVDMLEPALKKLQANAAAAGIGARMETLVADIENYTPNDLFDFVLSVSAIEHVSSGQALRNLIGRLQEATRPGGVHCFMIATQHLWLDAASGEKLEPLVELNITAAETKSLLRDQYHAWKIKDMSAKAWEVAENYSGRDVLCKSTCVQFTASNGGRK